MSCKQCPEHDNEHDDDDDDDEGQHKISDASMSCGRQSINKSINQEIFNVAK